MDTSIQISSILGIAGTISTIGGAWWTIRKLSRDLRKDRELESAKILQEAKEADARLKAALEAKREVIYQELNNKIGRLESRLDNLEESVTKDFAHVRETYNGEIRNLGDKIEDLRSELRSQHGQLVALLGKMIDNRD